MIDQKENGVDHPENATMEVLVVVAFPELKTSTSEKAWEEGIIDAISTAVYADKTLDTLAVRRLEYEDCQWVFDGGMPLPDYDVTVFQDGSWHSSTDLYRTDYDRTGPDLQSLFEYLIEQGMIKR